MTTKDLEMTLTLRNRNYKVVSSISEVPLGYVVWNIGRHNFIMCSTMPVRKTSTGNNERVNKAWCKVSVNTIQGIRHALVVDK